MGQRFDPVDRFAHGVRGGQRPGVVLRFRRRQVEQPRGQHRQPVDFLGHLLQILGLFSIVRAVRREQLVDTDLDRRERRADLM